ncbi:MAG: peptidoglycan recognition protein family protein [Nanoarchaeota archaeon]|nr:peptidoglycan recognition protein family protein [Nanoarchaeota archaeon]MCG2718247.1 peptidoglycan recognition protein family protein [Nanoarchaeota archaeon]
MNIENKIHTTNVEGLSKNSPKYLIIHANKSYPDFADLLMLHKYKNGWEGIGYHLFVSNSNRIYQARPFDKRGAHAKGFNSRSIALSFYKENNDIDEMKVHLGKYVIKHIQEKYPEIEIIPHTLAQTEHINKLLRMNKIDKKFPETIELVNEKLSQEIKKDMFEFSETLPNNYKFLKIRLRNFNNCPGEIFHYFV